MFANTQTHPVTGKFYSADREQANTIDNFMRDCDIAAAKVYREHGLTTGPRCAELIRRELLIMGHDL